MTLWRNKVPAAIFLVLLASCKTQTDTLTVPDAAPFDAPNVDVVIDSPLDVVTDAGLDASDASDASDAHDAVEASSDSDVGDASDARDANDASDAHDASDANDASALDAGEDADASDASDATDASDASDSPIISTSYGTVSVALVSPSLVGARYDVCVHVFGAGWGPPDTVLWGLTGGIAYPTVAGSTTEGSDVPLEGVLIPPGDTCDSPAGLRLSIPGGVSTNGYATVVIWGDAATLAANGGVSIFQDEVAPTTGGALRFVNAIGALSPVDLVTVGTTTDTLFSGVDTGNTPGAPADANGYVAQPTGTVTYALRATGTTTDVARATLPWADGQSRTMYAIGDGSSAAPYQLYVCSSSGNTALADCTAYGDPKGASDAGGSMDASDAGDAAPTMGSLRFLHAAGDAPTALDACFRRQGATTWTGPVLAGAGVPGGLSFGQVTRRFDLDTTQPWQVAFIPAPATDCSAADSSPQTTTANAIPGFAALVAALPGKNVSFTIEETGSVPGVTTVAFAQHVTQATGYDLTVRVSSSAGDAGTITHPPVTFPTAVYAGSHALPPGCDSYGYLGVPSGTAELRLGFAGSADAFATIPTATLGDGERHTFLLTGDGKQSTQLLDCNDGAIAGPLTSCVSHPVTESLGTASVRVAQLIPDFGAPVKLCSRPLGSELGFAASPLVTGAIDYPNVSPYASVEARGQDLLVIQATDDCTTSTPIVALSYGGVGQSLSYTWMLAGLSHSSPPVTGVLLLDETSPPSVGYGVRAVSAVPRTDVNVVIGPSSIASLGQDAWAYVGFASIATTGGVDALGYVTSTDADPLWSVVHDLGGNQSDVLWVQAFDTTVAPLLSVFAIGGAGGAPEQLLVCEDAFAGEGTPSCRVATPFAPRGLRVVNLAPAFAGADVCVRNTPANPAAPWTGVTPHLATGNGTPVTLGVGTMTGSWPPAGIGPGEIQVRLVDTGSATCDTAVAGWADYVVPAGLDPHGELLALFTSVTGALVDTRLFGTRVTPAPSGAASVRFINALDGYTLDIGEKIAGGTDIGTRWGTLATYEGTCTQSDAFGLIDPAASPGPIAIGSTALTGPTPVLYSVAASTTAGSVYDVFAFYDYDQGALMVCDEATPPGPSGIVPCATGYAP